MILQKLRGQMRRLDIFGKPQMVPARLAIFVLAFGIVSFMCGCASFKSGLLPDAPPARTPDGKPAAIHRVIIQQTSDIQPTSRMEYSIDMFAHKSHKWLSLQTEGITQLTWMQPDELRAWASAYIGPVCPRVKQQMVPDLGSSQKVIGVGQMRLRGWAGTIGISEALEDSLKQAGLKANYFRWTWMDSHGVSVQCLNDTVGELTETKVIEFTETATRNVFACKEAKRTMAPNDLLISCSQTCTFSPSEAVVTLWGVVSGLTLFTIPTFYKSTADIEIKVADGKGTVLWRKNYRDSYTGLLWLPALAVCLGEHNLSRVPDAIMQNIARTAVCDMIEGGVFN